jgi:hypothetical protein
MITVTKPKSQRGRQPKPLLCPDEVRESANLPIAENSDEQEANVLLQGTDFPADLKVPSAAQRIRTTVERIGLKGSVSIGFGHWDGETLSPAKADDANALILSPKVISDESETTEADEDNSDDE